LTTASSDKVTYTRHSYGDRASQCGDLYPACGSSRRGIVALVHGGFWRTHRGLEMTAPAAVALASRGWHVWNIEYRRGGSWRQTLDDCLQALEYLHLLDEHVGTDSAATVLVGHSAGGHLAARVAPRVSQRIDGLVTLNGVLDLSLAHELDIGDSAVAQFLGPDATAHDLAFADAAQNLPAVPVRCVHSRDDERVPFEISARYTEKACRAQVDCRLIEVSGHHTAVIEPGSAAWPTVLRAIEAPWPKAQDAESNT
jgi:acetyl esterase/lipase